MDILITYDEVITLVVNPPTLTPRPNFTNLRALRCHLQCALQRLVDPQSYVLGWSGLVMSRPMYQLLSTSPFCLPNDPGPLAIYYGARVPILDAAGNPVDDATGNATYVPIPALDRAMQATINARFLQERNYWLLYRNIKRACYNMLDDSVNDAFKFSPDPNLTGWNSLMEITQPTDARRPPHSSKTTRDSGVHTPPSMHPRSSSVGSRIARKSRHSGMTRIPQCSF